MAQLNSHTIRRAIMYSIIYIIAGFAQLNTNTVLRATIYSLIYIITTTLAASAIGVLCAVVMHPGTDTLREELSVFTPDGVALEIKGPLDANLDVLR